MHFTRMSIAVFFGAIALLWMAQAAHAKIGSEQDWPRRIEVPQGVIVIYQPQLEAFNDNELKARAAIEVTPKGDPLPSYGAMWIQARLFTDRDSRLAWIREIKVPQARFTGSTPEQERKLTAFLEEEIPKWDLTLSLDRLLLGMGMANQDLLAGKSLINDPPKILISKVPAVLITIAGNAKLKTIEGLDLSRVVNSPYQIFYDPQSKKYFINGGKTWFSADELKGEWKTGFIPPSNLTGLYDMRSAPSEAADSKVDERPPRIIVSTEPAELIVLNGPADFQPLAGNALLYAVNTESDVFLENDTGKFFVLLAGRWFRGASLDGPWEAVSANMLPACFAQIPADSAKGGVLAHVAGTAPAIEAVMDAQIPQTALIRRSEPVLSATYDGSPVFKPITGTKMKYAENSPQAVIELDGRYYCCQYAVWYDSEKPDGPWRISVSVPSQVYTIPPSCPLYNVTYVRVYNSTPDLVYVGYTPGYVGSYVANGTVVYGTGHAYPEWLHHDYIARPLTWGMHARYDPVQCGWSLLADYTSPGGRYRIVPGSVDGGGNRIIRWSMAGWWGAGGYRDYGDIRANAKAANAPPGSAAGVSRQNIYAMYEIANKLVSLQQTAGDSGARTAKVAEAASNQQNDLFVDSTGIVYRRTAKGWERRDVADWIEARLADPANQSEMDEEYRLRQEGDKRERKYEGISIR